MIQIDLKSGGDFSVEISNMRCARQMTAEVVITIQKEELYEKMKEKASQLDLTLEEWVSQLIDNSLDN